MRQALLISGIGSLIIGGGSYVVLSRQARAISDEEIASAEARAQALAGYYRKEITFTINDWSNWDLTYRFMAGREPDFIKHNVNRFALQNINIDEIAFVRPDGSIAEQFVMDQASARLPVWQNLPVDPALTRQVITSRQTVSGFAILHGRLHVFALGPIVTSYGLGTPRGVLVMARELPSQRISAALNLPVTFRPFSNAPRTLLRGTANVEVALPGLRPNRQAALAMAVPLPATQSARIAQVLLPIGLILLNFLLASVILRLFDKLVTRRVLALEGQVGKLAISGYIHRLNEDPLDDEISWLTRRINALLSRLDVMNAEERRLKQEALDAADAAQRAERAKSNFVAVTSHEIRTPLAVVLGGIELLLTYKLPKNAVDMVKRLDKAGERLKAVVDDVLDFSRIEHEGVVTELRPVDLVQILSTLVEGYRVPAQARNLDLEFETELDSAMVLADAFRIQQVLSNLLSNALKFTSRGSVQVTLNRRGNERWRIAVRDTGIGLDAAQLGNLFKPFTQADQSTVRRFGGTGLGLSICHRIVQAMGGEIGVNSTLGHGSTFWFELPLASVDPATVAQAQAQAQAQGRAAPAEPPRPVKPLSLLLVEDNQLVLGMLRDQLKAMGHRATCVNNGLAAFNAVVNQSFDAMLIDMHMPVMDGAAAARAIRALDAGSARGRGALPIVAITADADLSRRTIYQDIDFDAFLTKPCDATTLNAALANVGPAVPRRQVDAAIQSAPILAPDLLIETERTLGGAVLARHLQRFAGELDAAVDALVQLLSAREWERLSAQAHTLKGAALTVGAAKLQHILEGLEYRPSGFEPDGAAETLALVSADTKIALLAMVASLASADAGALAANA